MLVTVLAYLPTFTNGFTNWDDQDQVVDNTDIHRLSFANTGKIFTSFYIGMYQPFTTQVYAVLYSIGNGDAGVFHTFSLLVHLLNIMLVFFLVRKFTRRDAPALITSALFALNPMQAESVAWVSAMSNLLYTSFYLSGLIAYISHIRNGKFKYLLLTFFFFVLSLLSKPAAVTFPVLILLADLYYRRRPPGRLVLEKLPFFILAIGVGLLIIYARTEAGHIAGLSERYAWFERILLVFYALAHYVSVLFVPAGLSAFHPYPDSPLPPAYYIAPLLPLMLVFLVVRSRGEFRRQLTAGLVFFLVTIAVVMEIIPVGAQVVKERYVYLPSVGMYYVFSVLLLFLVSPGRARKWLPAAVTVLLVVVFAFLTHSRARVWQNSFTLWNDVLEQYPEASAALINRGNAWQERGDHLRAVSDYSLALRYEPMAADAYMNRGLAYYYLGETGEAISDLDKAIDLGLHDASTHNYRGLLRASRNDLRGALSDFRAATRLDTTYTEAWINRGLLHAELGDADSSMLALTQAIATEPASAKAFYYRGRLQWVTGSREKACTDFRKAISLGWPAEQIPPACANQPSQN